MKTKNNQYLLILVQNADGDIEVISIRSRFLAYPIDGDTAETKKTSREDVKQ